MGGSFLFRDEQNRRVEAHSRDSIFSYFDIAILKISYSTFPKLTAMCESYNFLESSTAFFCVLFTVHLLDILSWENNTFGYSWKSHPSPWLLWIVNEIVRDLHRAKKNNTTEEMMMENFLYGSSDGKLGPIALDFYYALQWMTLLSECGCSSWGASAEENRENWERERERKRVGRENASLPFCVLCWLAHGTLNFSPPCWYHSSMILSIFNSNVGTGRWAVRRAQEKNTLL